MFIADMHCDALSKMIQSGNLTFGTSSSAAVHAGTLQAGGIHLQNFAVFANPKKSWKKQRQEVWDQMKLFHKKVLASPTIQTTASHLPEKLPSHTQALLSLEGGGMFADDLNAWEDLKRNGIVMASLTWNEKNSLAAGSSHSNKHGLTQAGKRVIAWMNKNDIILDAAHLNEKSFWEALNVSNRMVVSHANVKGIYNHPRNLSDNQLTALVDKNSFIGLTFYPFFMNGTSEADYADLARQIEYLGKKGVWHIAGFGSDFDGIDHTVKGLTNPSDFPRLIEWLLKRFDEDIVKGICGENFRRFWNKKNISNEA
ncbi:dipeptidase [Bacillus piscicola]|uniref:dipeptidase n=1 Tax=Bacillus piscicola TaxID=1632684 RepID=UPI001F08A4A6|nr:membrane dipeptidase [Bacillus piscicola]